MTTDQGIDEEGRGRGYNLVVVLDEEDRSLLRRTADHEKLTMADIVRRALRQYARRLGVPREAPRDGQ
jgi:hypothetical protein